MAFVTLALTLSNLYQRITSSQHLKIINPINHKQQMHCVMMSGELLCLGQPMYCEYKRLVIRSEQDVILNSDMAGGRVGSGADNQSCS